MRIIVLLFCCIAAVTTAQVKYSEQTITGRVIGVHPGSAFALELVAVEHNGGSVYYRIDPGYGEAVINKIAVGQSLTFKANIRADRQPVENLTPERRDYFSRMLADKITAVQLDGKWISTPEIAPKNEYDVRWATFIDRKVVGTYPDNQLPIALMLQNGTVAYWLPYALFAGQRQVPDRISFIGMHLRYQPGYVYPVTGVTQVYTLSPLERHEGTVTSFLYKQNYVRIGLTAGGKKLSFPSEYAEKMKRFANGKSTVFYISGRADESTNLLPSIHAAIQGRDTLFIDEMYYGGPDRDHEFKAAEIEGAITSINKSTRGRLMSIIVGADCYIEIDNNTAAQLAPLLRRGRHIKVAGQERIKLPGEIYEQSYRIIEPQRITVGEQQYILHR